MTDSDDLSAKDPEFDQFAEDYEAHRAALFELVSEYMDKHDLEEGYVAQLLLDLTLNMRMAAYAMGVESPSVAGLRLDLDRWQREVVGFVRKVQERGGDLYPDRQGRHGRGRGGIEFGLVGRRRNRLSSFPARTRNRDGELPWMPSPRRTRPRCTRASSVPPTWNGRRRAFRAVRSRRCCSIRRPD